MNVMMTSAASHIRYRSPQIDRMEGQNLMFMGFVLSFLSSSHMSVVGVASLCFTAAVIQIP